MVTTSGGMGKYWAVMRATGFVGTLVAGDVDVGLTLAVVTRYTFSLGAHTHTHDCHAWQQEWRMAEHAEGVVKISGLAWLGIQKSSRITGLG